MLAQGVLFSERKRLYGLDTQHEGKSLELLQLFLSQKSLRTQGTGWENDPAVLSTTVPRRSPCKSWSLSAGCLSVHLVQTRIHMLLCEQALQCSWASRTLPCPLFVLGPALETVSQNGWSVPTAPTHGQEFLVFGLVARIWDFLFACFYFSPSKGCDVGLLVLNVDSGSVQLWFVTFSCATYPPHVFCFN